MSGEEIAAYALVRSEVPPSARVRYLGREWGLGSLPGNRYVVAVYYDAPRYSRQEDRALVVVELGEALGFRWMRSPGHPDCNGLDAKWWGPDSCRWWPSTEAQIVRTTCPACRRQDVHQGPIRASALTRTMLNREAEPAERVWEVQVPCSPACREWLRGVEVQVAADARLAREQIEAAQDHFGVPLYKPTRYRPPRGRRR